MLHHLKGPWRLFFSTQVRSCGYRKALGELHWAGEEAAGVVLGSSLNGDPFDYLISKVHLMHTGPGTSMKNSL